MKESRLKGFLLWIFLLSVFFSYSQNRPPQDIRKVTVTLRYVLENGKKTENYWAVYQEIYDSLGRLHTEIEYDFNDHYPHNYTWHYFAEKQKVKTDFFRNEKLAEIHTYSYNADSLLIKNTIQRVTARDTSVYLVISFKYNDMKKPVLTEALTGKGKLAYRSSSKFDLSGTEISRKVKVKAGFSPLDSLTRIIRIPFYDSLNRLVSEKITITDLFKNKTTTVITYSYNKKGDLSEIIRKDINGNLISREERLYQELRNRLGQIKYYDQNNVLVKHLVKRYEIYKTKDRRERIIDY